MMKASMSLAVLALLGKVSASEVENQLGNNRYYHQHNYQNLADLNSNTKSHTKAKKLTNEQAPYYKETDTGRKWFELDDHTERIHGTEIMDDVSPHDPDVADAPEDMTRVGNDHTPLHNAKLSPVGYYNGWFHKDSFGNYVQKNGRKISMAQAQQMYRHPRRMHNQNALQLSDNIDDTTMVSYLHEDDTDDIPNGMDPIMVQENHKVDAQKEEYLKQCSEFEKDLAQYDNVQLNYEHQTDTDDIPDGFDPYDKKYQHAQKSAPSSKSLVSVPYLPDGMNSLDEIEVTGTGTGLVQRRRSAYLDEKAQQAQSVDNKMQAQSDEIQKIMDSQSHEVSNLQTGSYINSKMPHEADTEDIAVEVSPNTYDAHHSAKWNKEVDAQATQIENEIKISENIRVSQEKAAEIAQQKAIRERAEKRAAAEAERSRRSEQKKVEVVQVAQKKSHTTVDFGELYNGMLFQTQQDHSPQFDALVEKRTQQIAAEMKKQESADEAIQHPTHGPNQKNPSIDIGDMYHGLGNGQGLVQLRYLHEDDPDDVLAENSEVYGDQHKSEPKPDTKSYVDFEGGKFTEDYD